VTEILAQRGLALSTRRRNLDEGDRAGVLAVAEEIAKAVDEVLGS
jgi:hypothetical protein